MKKEAKILLSLFSVLFVLFAWIGPASGQVQGTCVDGLQTGQSYPSGYRICMPPDNLYNGRFIIWAHGFQDAGTPVGIPEEQLCFDDVCIPDLVLSMGFGFATNSYRKTGLAVTQGEADILDLVNNLQAYSIDPNCEDDNCEPIVPEQPKAVYIIGASEGGLIAALLVEQHPELFSAGYALCGPIGDFPSQINYLGDARAVFEYFFPGKIPGYGVFNDLSTTGGYIMPGGWDAYFENVIRPLLENHPWKADQWFKVAKLPYDLDHYHETVLNSAKDVLRYSVVNMPEAIEVLGGQPFDNRRKWYTGSSNDFLLNWKVKRIAADPDAVAAMKAGYNTSGALDRPLVTMHTLRDPQVPYWHETLYNLKAIANGSLLKDHYNIPVDRYGHCNFTPEEAMGGFSLMLLYAGDWQVLPSLEALMQSP